MQQKQPQSMLQNASQYFFLKTQLSNFAKKQMERYESLNYLVDQFVHKQKIKINFKSEEYLQASRDISTELDIYVADLGVKITSFPLLGPLAKIFNKIMAQYSRVLSHTQQFWITQLRNLRKDIDRELKPPPAMEMCLNCSQNMRQQEIHQAKKRVYNPISDPFQFYSIGQPKKVEVVEETTQKQLQDKLSELASNVQFGQSCIKDMLIQLAAEQVSHEDSYVHKQTEEGNLPLIPLVKSVYKRVKDKKKQNHDYGIQVNSLTKEKHQQLDLLQVEAELKDEGLRFSKRSSQFEEKNISTKQQQEKLRELQKQKKVMKSQIEVVKHINLQFQSKISQLQLQLSILKAQKAKTAKKYRTSKSMPRKLQQKAIDSIPENSKQMQKVPQQRKRRSHRKDTLRIKKQVVSPSNLLNNRSGLLGQDRTNNRKVSRMVMRNESRMLRHTDLTYKRQLSSSHSIVKIDDGGEDIDNQGFMKPHHKTSQNIFKEESLSKTVVSASGTKTYTKLKSFKEKLSMEQKRKLRQMLQVEDNSQTSKDRRVGEVYSRQQILKIIYEQQIKNQNNPVSYEEFRQACDNFISQAVEGKCQSIQVDQQKQNKNDDQERLKSKNLKKKSAAKLKQRLRSDLIRPKLGSQKNSHKLKGLKSHYVSHHTSFRDQLPSIDQKQTNNQALKLPQLKATLQVRSSFQHGRDEIVLQKDEHKMVTQLMAYLAKLKSKSKNNYEAMRRLLQSLNQNQNKSKKQNLQNNVTQIIAMHRACTKYDNQLYCSHLKQFVQTVEQFIL